MKQAISGPIAMGIIVVVVLIAVCAGWYKLSGGGSGKKPEFKDSRVDKMFTPPGATGGPNAPSGK